MGLFSKTKQGFLGTTQHALGEMQTLGAQAAKAAGATLEKLTRQPIQITRSSAYLVPRDKAAALLAHHEGAHVAARFALGGAAPGTVATLFSKDDALELVALLLARDKGSVKRLGDLERSAIAEMTNIALNGAITVLATQGGVRFETGVPTLESPLSDVDLFTGYDGPAEIDHSVVIEATFRETTRGITGTLVMVFGVHGRTE